ncbi:MAG: 2-succinyl-6-hydroxy-2,4-cyclohexadiene-1-carboxylate synthase [Chloroflexota bacterium]
MPTISINQTNYYYENAGFGEPLLLLHGFTGSTANWQRHVPVLAAHYQVIAVDILGHGQTAVPTDPTRYQMPTVAADIVALLAALDINSCHLLGYSMGGRLSLYLAAHYPHLWRSLILESSSPGLETAVEREERIARDNGLADRIERDGIVAFVDFWENIGLFASQRQLETAVRQTLRQQRLRNSPLGLANSLRGMGTGQQPSLWSHLSQLRLHTLLLVGSLDSKFVAINKQIARQMPNVQCRIILNAGHTVHLEKPDEFCQNIFDFLSEERR